MNFVEIRKRAQTYAKSFFNNMDIKYVSINQNWHGKILRVACIYTATLSKLFFITHPFGFNLLVQFSLKVVYILAKISFIQGMDTSIPYFLYK